MEIFGWTISKSKSPAVQPTPVTPINDGSSVIVQNAGNSAYMSGCYGYTFDLDGMVRTEAQMIGRYRDVASLPDVDTAIEQIVNEAVIVDQTKAPVTINLDNLDEQYQPIRDQISKQFDVILNLLNFNRDCHDIFKRWYVDGKLYYFVVIDPKSPHKGIQQLKYVDPRKIRKVVEYNKEVKNGVEVVTGSNEYYIFNDDGLQDATVGVRITTDSVIRVKSGLIDANTGEIISYLFKAIKPANQLKMMEDALVIYRITRAPERRVFYVDVGNLPAQKAEQYVANIMSRFRNKVVYDAATGEVKNNRNYTSIIEDFWLPRREGGKATEIQTLPAGCLAMDTKVSLLDGRELTIREIEQQLKNGNRLWTYSCNPTTGKIVPGLISWAGVTQKSANVVKITLDNGQSVVCTYDHKFPVIGRGFVRADKLEINDSIYPLNRRHAKIDKQYKLEYEQYFDNEDKQWYFTHRKVHDYVYGIDEDLNHRVIHHKDYDRFNNDPSNLVQMDWEDHRKLHNQVGFNEYRKRIGEQNYAKLKKQWGLQSWIKKSAQQKKDHIKRMSDGRKNYFDNLTDQQRERFNSRQRELLKRGNATRQKLLDDPQYRAQFVEHCKAGRTAEVDAHIRDIITTTIDDTIANKIVQYCLMVDPNKISAKRIAEYLSSDDQVVARFQLINKDKRSKNSTKITKYTIKRLICSYFGCDWDQFIQSIRANSTIEIDDTIAKAIVDLVKNDRQITGSDIAAVLNTRDELVERLHQLNGSNYRFTEINVKNAIVQFYGFDNWSAFRHNAKYINHRIVAIEYLEDPIEVGTLTIDKLEIHHDYHTFALSCGIFTKNSNLNELDDVRHFQNKLYQALNVPKQRLIPENNFALGNSSEITREEIMFAKFIQRLRNNFNSLFVDALRIQLITTKTIKPADWDKIKNSIYFEYQHDNYFEEIKRLEVFNERITQLQAADGYKGIYFSKEWIVKNILEFGTDQWDQIQQQIREEKVAEAREAALEQKIRDSIENDQQGDFEDNIDNDNDNSYDDFVNGNDSIVDDQTTEGDVTDTIDDSESPNPGDDQFDRPAEPQLKVTK